jgi:hypothetical protein
MKSRENDTKSSFIVIAEIRAIIRLKKSLSKIIWLLDSDAGMEECIFGRRELRQQFDIFESKKLP